MNHKTTEVIGNIIIPSIENKSVDSVLLRLIYGENPVLEFKFTSSSHPMNIPIIIGTFTGLGDITFLNCTLLGASSGASGTIVKYNSLNYIKGHHFKQKEELLFNRVSIEVPQLTSWFKSDCIEFKDIENQTHVIISNLHKYENIISENISLSFNLVVHESHSRNKAVLEETIYLVCETIKSKISLDDILDLFQHLLKFLVFIQPFDPKIESIILRNDDLCHEFGKEKHIKHINLYINPIQLSIYGSLTSFFFEFEEIKPNLESILQKWFDPKITSTIDLLLSNTFEPNVNIENHFLNICFAIESFHRQFINNKTFTDEEFDERIQYINKSIENEEINKWLVNKLQHGNEPSFRTRLKYFKEILELIIDTNIKTFINNIIDTRNYLVHRDKKTKRVLKRFELFYSIRYLEILLKINIMDFLGIKIETYKRKLELLKIQTANIKKMNS